MLTLAIHLKLINLTMKNILKISNTIRPFKKIIEMEGDKSLSIRWALIASQASDKSIAYNLLQSEDVINTLNCLNKPINNLTHHRAEIPA